MIMMMMMKLLHQLWKYTLKGLPFYWCAYTGNKKPELKNKETKLKLVFDFCEEEGIL